MASKQHVHEAKKYINHSETSLHIRNNYPGHQDTGTCQCGWRGAHEMLSGREDLQDSQLPECGWYYEKTW